MTTTEQRLDAIRRYKQRKEKERMREEQQRLQEERFRAQQALMELRIRRYWKEQIKSLAPRMRDMLNVANAMQDAKIELDSFHMKGKSRPAFYSRMPFTVSLLNNEHGRVAYLCFRTSRLNDELIIRPNGNIIKETTDARHLRNFYMKFEGFEQKFYRYADMVTSNS